ncbi:MAG: 4Fe-4S dicluster domain-containing protein [Sphingomonadales bacterium]
MPEQPEDSTTPKWNLIIDVAKSAHGNNAILAAKDEYVGNDYPGYSAPIPEKGGDIFTLTRKVRGETPMVDAAYLLKTCNHCDAGPCQKVGGDAVKKRPDGITIIDPVKAKGRKDIVKACPHGAIIWNEELEIPQIWTFDAHLLDQGWPHPRCVDACPPGAIEAVKITDAEMKKRAEAEGLEILKPEIGTKPRVYYKNLYRFTTCFIGGTVIAATDGVEDCVEGAEVLLMKAGDVVGSATSNEFGEFKIDNVDPGSGPYSLEARHKGLGTATAEADVGDSVYLGTLALTQ